MDFTITIVTLFGIYYIKQKQSSILIFNYNIKMIFNLNINCFQFFGLSEKAIQTDLTLQDILKIDFKKKQINYNNNKQDPLMAPSDYNELNNKKQISNKLINSNKSDNYENKNKDLKGKEFFANCKVTLSKIFKKGKEEIRIKNNMNNIGFIILFII